MAAVIPYFDTRSIRKDGASPLKLMINHLGKTAYISLKIYIIPAQWDSKDGRVLKSNPNNVIYNDTLKRRMHIANDVIFKLSEKGIIKNKTAKQIKEYIDAGGVTDHVVSGNVLIKPFFEKLISTRNTIGTKEIYTYTLNKLKTYTDIDSLTFADISFSFCKDFDNYLAKTCKINSRYTHFRNLRAVFNAAINEDVIPLECYPFRKFKFKSEATPKRSMTAGELRILRDYPCEPWQEKWRDMFMLIFYLIGINTIDLMNLKAIRNGRIEYRRAKTGRLYVIEVNPEAQSIIDKYRGVDHLLSFADAYINHVDFRHRMNLGLQKIGTLEWVANQSKANPKNNKKKITPLFPGITSYWARHSWATIAASLDIPKETIAAALGHGGNSVTDIYIDFDQKKVDEANRKVIDYLNRNE